MLLGRGAECDRIDRLLAEARAGRSGSLVIEGDAGVGKTALLQYAAERAGAMCVVSARGLESESELPFSVLADLLRPLRDYLDRLAPVQAAALEGALALGPPAAADRFTIYAATLSLLSAASESRPLLVVVDDTHWIDAASLEALLFASRRLMAEGIAVMFVVRRGEPLAVDITGIPVLPVGGLSLEASRLLLAACCQGPLAGSVADVLHESTRGNPLALMEIPPMLSQAQRAGTEALPDPLPAGAALQRALHRRVLRLSLQTQQALVVAAASQSGATDVILRALPKLGLSPAALEEAEAVDLLTTEKTTILFRHPLLRSAVYHAAPGPTRRAVHRALAASMAGDETLHQRSWHLAAATLGPDEEIATMLERAGADARSRTGYAAAAAAFERAAELTPDAGDQARRLLAAADAAQLAGKPERARQSLSRAEVLTSDRLIQADIAALRGAIELWHGLPQLAIDGLTAAAEAVESWDAVRAARMLVNAVSGCYMTGDITRAGVIGQWAFDVGRRAGGSTEVLAGMALAGALMLRGEAAQGLPHVAQGLSLMAQADPQDAFELHRQAAYILLNVEDFARARVLLEWMLDVGGKLSAPAMLPYPLACLSEVEYRAGRWDAAYARATEAVRLARETGQLGPSSYGLVCLARVEAAMGREEDCRSHVMEATDAAGRLGLDSIRHYCAAAIGLLDLGTGRAAAAIQSLEICTMIGRRHGLREPSVVQWAPDMIEACIRDGRIERARDELEVLASQAGQTGRVWALAALARCHGLLPGEPAFEDRFREALSWHERVDMPFERARTELALGETLRRHGRRIEARTSLSSALVTFEQLGAHPWAARARAELSATGMRAQRPKIPASHQLTPQELQVALAVARGATNREAATELFLSLKTIEAHLTSTYSKLGLRSRSELAALFAREAIVQPRDMAVAARER